MKRGFSVAEVLIAGSLMLGLMITAEATVRYLWQNNLRLRDGLGTRQQVRHFYLQLRRDLRSASYLFLGYNGTLMGEHVVVPSAGASGSSLLFAIPSDDSADTEYTVCLLTPRLRSQYDANNPQAREILYHRFKSVRSTPPNTPGGLLPGSLPQGTSRVFDCYLAPGSAGFNLKVTPNAAGVQVVTQFLVNPQRGNPVTERYDAFFTLRNNV
ncbi:hypothetical protein JST97_36610 [bacterium]|nr:hypothetical protein [bacterium]